MPEEQSAEDLFRDNVDLVDRVLASTGRRFALRPHEVEEFAGWARLRLIDDDYATLRKFRGEARFSTYLVTVVRRLAKDWIIARRGKWRPSTAARRLGTAAVRLEVLISFDGRTTEEAVETLKRNEGVRASRQELYRLAEELPYHPPRRHYGGEGLERMPADASTDERALDHERESRAEEVEEALARALAGLDDEDRLILQMRFEQDVTVASIARTLGLDQRRLYTRVHRLTGELRRALESDGVDAERVRDLLGWDRLQLEVDYDAPPQPSPPGEIRPAGPSHG